MLRRFDPETQEERSICERLFHALADYREQLGRPFEHEARLRELLFQQQGINRHF